MPSDGVVPQSQVQGHDKFGRLALQRGFITQEQLDEAILVQKASAKAGFRKKLGDVLIKKGYLTAHQVRQILAAQTASSSIKRVGDYEILSKLGEGGMGAVYKARQISMDRLIALKILSNRMSNKSDARERFIREARAVAKLNHPHIIAGIDVGSSGQTHYFAMEFVEGETLKERMHRKGGKLSPHDALNFTRQMALALHHAHTHGLLHRDVKPENILIDKDGQAKLADLGLARSSTQDDDASLTQQGMAVGTPFYISPEQARGSSDLTPGTDLYSLGATLFHLLTGQPPFEGPTGAVIMAKHVSSPAPDPRSVNPEISTEIAKIVMKLLKKDPKERHKDGMTLADELRRAMENIPGATKPKVAVSPTPEPKVQVQDDNSDNTTHIRASRITRRQRESEVPGGLLVVLGIGILFVVVILFLSPGGSEFGSSSKRPAPPPEPSTPPQVNPTPSKAFEASKTKASPLAAKTTAAAHSTTTKVPLESSSPSIEPHEIGAEVAMDPADPKGPERPLEDPGSGLDLAFLDQLATLAKANRFDEADQTVAKLSAAAAKGRDAELVTLALKEVRRLAAQWDGTRMNLLGKTATVGTNTGTLKDLTADSFALSMGKGASSVHKWPELSAAERLRLMECDLEKSSERVACGMYRLFQGEAPAGARALLDAEKASLIRFTRLWHTWLAPKYEEGLAADAKVALAALRQLDQERAWPQLKEKIQSFEQTFGKAVAAHATELAQLRTHAEEGLAKTKPVTPTPPVAVKTPTPVEKKGIETLFSCSKFTQLTPTVGHVELRYDFSTAEQMQDFASNGAGSWVRKGEKGLEFDPRGSTLSVFTHKARWVSGVFFRIDAKMEILELSNDGLGLGYRDSNEPTIGKFVSFCIGNTRNANNRRVRTLEIASSEDKPNLNRGYLNPVLRENETIQVSLIRLNEDWKAMMGASWSPDNRKRKDVSSVEYPGHAFLFSSGSKILIKEVVVQGYLDPEWLKANPTDGK